MEFQQKQKTAALVLAVLGIAIGAIGVAGGMAPPIITGLGFLVLAWALPARPEQG